MRSRAGSDRLNFLAIGALLLYPSVGKAKTWSSYLASYRLGIEWKASSSNSDLSYQTKRALFMPDQCKENIKDPAVMDCTSSLTQNRPTSIGISIQQVFERTGWFYSNFDLGFSSFMLDAKALETDESILVKQPLKKARVHLYGLNMKGYYEFGVTPPRILPDILLSIGIGGHYSRGNVKIDDQREDVEVVSNIIYFQYELVWWRFKDGSLSTYVNQESNVKDQRLNGKFGDFSRVTVTPSQYSYGLLKLVLPLKTQ